jgi:hypothetical protein
LLWIDVTARSADGGKCRSADHVLLDSIVALGIAAVSPQNRTLLRRRQSLVRAPGDQTG